MSDNNISTITLVASKTFPAGITFNALAYDADPDFEIAETRMGPNGHMVYWKVCKPRTVTIWNIESTYVVNSMYELTRVNRVGYGKKSINDTISITIEYSDGNKGIYTNGILISGPLEPRAPTTGNLKTSKFVFRFRDFEGCLPSF